MTPLASDIGVQSLAFEDSIPAVYPDTHVSSEVEQMRAAIAGDQAAMRSVYEREAPRLLRRLGHLCGDPAMAQDLLQECFMRAFAGEVSFAGSSEVPAWLHGVALNLWRNEVRKQARRRGLLGRGAASVQPRALPAPGEGREQDELQLRLRDGLRSLSPQLREAFVLRVLEALPLAEAAALADVSMATLSRRATKAEAKLRKCFEQTSHITDKREQEGSR